MRRWGIALSVIYALIVIVLLVPLAILLGGEHGLLTPDFYRDLRGSYTEWVLWIPIVMLLCGQAALLFLSVDTSHRRLKPRGPVMRSAIVASMLFMIMSVAVVCCVGVAIGGDNFGDRLPDEALILLGALGGLWAAWGVVFYLYLRGSTEITTRVVSWLLRGSILELLIAVPSHVIVRRRGDCSAPLATSFGITTGIAIMLMSFGPSVLFLYKRRMDSYRTAQENRERAMSAQ